MPSVVGLTWDACPLKPSRWPATSGAEVKTQSNLHCCGPTTTEVVLYELDLGQAPQWFCVFSAGVV